MSHETGNQDMLRGTPDIIRIQRLIGYRPVLGLPEMPERVIAYERAEKMRAKT